MKTVTIDGNKVEVQEGTTIIQACEKAGVEIPRFCYHEKLKIAGNCRMCLVEVEKMPKPVASCAQVVMDGMVVKTNSPKVKQAREGVMEFLLINHPLDCPICDQGGECDLQDQAMLYGQDKTRFHESKRAVPAKDFGPLIKTFMTRCIHCTRCVRFLEDIGGIEELGAIGRGENMEISTYVEKSLTSELSGNIIDLCPVGALTSKPYAFTARSWELQYTNSIDVTDAVGSNIRIDSKGGLQVMRIVPRINEQINEEWIGDKIRFCYDGLRYQRLDRPLKRDGQSLVESSFDECYQEIANVLHAVLPENVGSISGSMTDLESMYIMRKFLDMLGVENYDCRQTGLKLRPEDEGFYTFNTTITKIAEADYCLIIGANPRKEAAILNAHLRQAVKNGLKVALIGNNENLGFNYLYLGDNPWLLKQIVENKHDVFNDLKMAKNPMIIVGQDVLECDDANAFIYYFKKICVLFNVVRDDWNGFNMLPRVAALVGGLKIGFVPSDHNVYVDSILRNSTVLFLLGADEVDFNAIPTDTFVVYIGHHGDKAAYRADIILPSPAFTEKQGTFVNLEGRVQRAEKAVSSIGEAQEEWRLVLGIAKAMGIDIGVESFEGLQKDIAKNYAMYNNLGVVDVQKISMDYGKLCEFTSDKFAPSAIHNYYMTDSISRSSPTMAECTKRVAG